MDTTSIIGCYLADFVAESLQLVPTLFFRDVAFKLIYRLPGACTYVAER